MAHIKIQQGCGHDRVIETPGPEDPEGLLLALATSGATHRAPGPCPECIQKGVRPPALAGAEHSPAAPRAEEPPAEAASLGAPLRSPLRIHPFDWKRLVDSSKSTPGPVLLDREKGIFEFEGRDYQVTPEVPRLPAGEIEGLLAANAGGDRTLPGAQPIHPADWARLTARNPGAVRTVRVDEWNSLYEFEGREYEVTPEAPTVAGNLQTAANPPSGTLAHEESVLAQLGARHAPGCPGVFIANYVRGEIASCRCSQCGASWTRPTNDPRPVDTPVPSDPPKAAAKKA